METGLLHTHSFLRWIILLLLLIIVVRHLTAGNRPFNSTDKTFGLILEYANDQKQRIGYANITFSSKRDVAFSFTIQSLTLCEFHSDSSNNVISVVIQHVVLEKISIIMCRDQLVLSPRKSHSCPAGTRAIFGEELGNLDT